MNEFVTASESRTVTAHEIFNNIKKKYLPNESLGFDKEGIEGVRQRRISQIQSGKYFGIPVIKEYRWNDIYDAERYSLLLSFAPHAMKARLLSSRRADTTFFFIYTTSGV